MSPLRQTARSSDAPGGRNDEAVASNLKPIVAVPRSTSSTIDPDVLEELEKRSRDMLRLTMAADLYESARDVQDHSSDLQFKVPWITAGEGGRLHVIWVPVGKRKGGPPPTADLVRVKIVQGWRDVKGTRKLTQEAYCRNASVDPKTLRTWEKELVQKGLLPPEG